MHLAGGHAAVGELLAEDHRLHFGRQVDADDAVEGGVEQRLALAQAGRQVRAGEVVAHGLPHPGVAAQAPAVRRWVEQIVHLLHECQAWHLRAWFARRRDGSVAADRLPRQPLVAGTDAVSDQSWLMSAAVRSSRGRCSSMSVSTEVSAAWTVTLMAATTLPSPSRTPVATERMPGARSWSARAQPFARTSRSAASRSAAAGCQRAAMPDRDGSARTAFRAAGGRAASNTLPIEVAGAGKRVPMVTASVTIFGTATRAT